MEDPNLKEGDFQIGTHPAAPGEMIANYKGQLIALPKVMHLDAKKNSAYSETPMGGGGKEQGLEALPASVDKERSGPLREQPTPLTGLTKGIKGAGEFLSSYPGALQE